MRNFTIVWLLLLTMLFVAGGVSVMMYTKQQHLSPMPLTQPNSTGTTQSTSKPFLNLFAGNCGKLQIDAIEAMEKLNYCATDEDCVFEDSCFVCSGYFRNRNADTSSVENFESQYREKCGICPAYSQSCPSLGDINPKCVNNRCG